MRKVEAFDIDKLDVYKLEAEILKRGFTYTELDKMVGRSVGYLCKILNRRTVPSKTSMMAYCGVIGLNLDDVILKETYKKEEPVSNTHINAINQIVRDIKQLNDKLETLTTQNEELIGIMDAIRVAWGAEMNKKRSEDVDKKSSRG